MSSNRRVIVLAATFLLSVPSFSQVLPEGSVAVYSIDSSAVVTSSVRTGGISGDLSSGLDIKMTALETFPKILGTADPMKYAQALPGVTTNSDWESGLRIQGCEAGLSVTQLCGVPVYGQGHILGIFSVFNPGHFEKISFSTSTDMRRLGGALGLDIQDTLSTALHGEANLGPVSTHATFAFPVGKKSTLIISGRRSFIDIFYKGLIKMDGIDMKYVFCDANASFLYVPDKYNKLDANIYFGYDDGLLDADMVGSMAGGRWGNAVASLRWRHKRDDLDMTTQAYGSAYFVKGDLALTVNSGGTDNHIADFGIRSNAKWRAWEFVVEADYYNILPQNIQNGFSSGQTIPSVPEQHAVLTTLRSSYKLFDGDFTLKPAIAASLYSDISYNGFYPRLDPEVLAGYNFYRGGRLSLEAGYKHQYLFLTGMTGGGFPVEFWLGCGRYSKPQSSLFGTLSYTLDFLNDAFTLNLQTYGKRLRNITEYSGFLSDLASGNYDLKKMILTGEGLNYGVTAQLQKNTGRLTGWISYSWGRSLRRFDSPDFPYVYPSSYERIHELNAVASYKIRRWEFGGEFIFASGIPYTPITSAYFLNQKLMIKYGERNSMNLSPYIRLDLSASFNIRDKGRFRDGVNISVQNATARENQMMAALKVKDGQYSFKPMKLLMPVLPSVGYYCKF